jgi:ATP-dependent Clp protease ATP-binding subunit ClpA
VPASRKNLSLDAGRNLSGYDFTTRVRGALIKAREEAQRRHHEYVGTEHLFIGLLAEEDALVMDVLDNLGVNPMAVQQAVEQRVTDGRPGRAKNIADLPYTPRARVVLDQAIATAHEFGDGYVGTQHLLLGLMRERHGIAAQELTAAGLTEPRLHREIVRLLQGEGVAAMLDDVTTETTDTQVPLSIAVEVRYEDGTLAKKVFASKDAAIGFLRDKPRSS